MATPGGTGILPPPGNGLCQGTLGWGLGEEELDPDGPQGSCHRTRQLERVPSLWFSTCRLQQGGRNVDSQLLGGLEVGTTFQEGNLATQTQVLETCILMAQHFHG